MIRTGLLLQPWVPGGVREHGGSLCWWRNLGVWRISPLSSSERAPDGVVRPRLCSFLPQLHPQCPSQAQFWSLHGCSTPPIPATCCKDVGSKGSRFKSYCVFLRSMTLDSQCSLSLSLRGMSSVNGVTAPTTRGRYVVINDMTSFCTRPPGSEKWLPGKSYFSSFCLLPRLEQWRVFSQKSEGEGSITLWK